MRKNNYFYCYNSNLRKFLDQNGTRWVNKGVHNKTGNPYWVFEQTVRLNGLLKRYQIETQNTRNPKPNTI